MLVVDRFIRDAACRCFWPLALAVVGVLMELLETNLDGNKQKQQKMQKVTRGRN